MADPPTRPPRQPEDAAEPEDGPRHVTRHLQPLGPRVLVRVLESPARLESGLYLPQGAKDSHAEALLGEVVEVARTKPKVPPIAEEEGEPDEAGSESEPDPSLGENVSGVPLGSRVLFAKDRGVTVPWDETLRVLDVRHILALVEEISEDEIQ
jgi:co-chaperonin GroES (HSP10)